jgi:hypothetical protein
MKRKTIFKVFFLCLFALPAISQVTVGSTAAPIPGSVLDVESTNQGILFPRVSLSATGTWGLLGSGTTGMVVYNTNASITGTGASGAGLYYWNNAMSLWYYIQSGTLNFWSLSGNASTTPGTNYIGTSDAQSLYFKVNGTQAGYLQYAATAANANTTFGLSASASNSSTALGAAAAASGTNSLAAGNSATANAANATAIGYGASAIASNATAIGNGATSAQANALILGNSSVSVGIGTNTPAQSLEIGYNTGTVRIDGLKSGKTYNSSSTAATSTLVYSNNGTGDLYSLPTVNSATLQTNSSGVPSWIPNTISSWQLLGNSGTTQPAVPATYGTSTFASGENFAGTTDSKDFVIGTSNTERMRFLANGSVGIGTSTPPRQLSVVSNAVSTSVETIENTNTGGFSDIDFLTSSGGLAGSVGYGNSTVAAAGSTSLQKNTFLYGNGGSVVITHSNSTFDLFVNASGNVGIGTGTPGYALEVTAASNPVRITGLQSGTLADSVLTVSNGVVRTVVPTPKGITGTIGTGATIPGTATGTFYNTGSYITLPPGKFMVQAYLMLSATNTPMLQTTSNQPGSFFIKTFFANSSLGTTAGATVSPALNAADVTPDIVGSAKLISGSLNQGESYNPLTGFVFINNTSGANKSYYLWAGWVQLTNVLTTNSLPLIGGTYYAEDNIVAFPVY